MKICKKCGLGKPFTDFCKKAANADGYRTCCKECKKPASGILVKKCSKCFFEKAITEFHIDAGTASGLCCWCKSCQSANNRRHLLENPDKVRSRVKKSWLKLAYGMTPEDKVAMIAAQEGCCACCHDPLISDFNSHIDHIHDSNPVVVRGILCPQCNVGLGNFKDSVFRLLKAVEYLKKFQKSS